MSMNDDRHTDRSDGDGTAKPAEDDEVKRRPYQAPRILSRERLESIAGFAERRRLAPAETSGLRILDQYRFFQRNSCLSISRRVASRSGSSLPAHCEAQTVSNRGSQYSGMRPTGVR